MFHQTVSVFIFRLKYVCRGELQHIKSSSFSIKHLTVQAISCHSQKRFLLSISSSTVKTFHQTGSVFIFRLKYVCRGELQHIKSSSFSIKHLTVQAISCHSQKKISTLNLEFDSENVPPDGVRFHISVKIRFPR